MHGPETRYPGAAVGLSCWGWSRLRGLLGKSVQRGLLLDLDGLHRDICDLKSRVLCDLKRVKLRGIESLRYSFEGTGQGSAHSRFLRQANAQSGTRSPEPHEMPAGLADHCVKDQRRDLFNDGPIIADGLCAGI